MEAVVIPGDGELDEYERRAPLLEMPLKKWVEGRRADFHYMAGRIAECIAWSERKGDGFQKKVAERLKEPETAERKRKRLDVKFVRQHRMTCAPATLASIATFWGREVDHLAIAEAICHDGTPWHKERRWAVENGFMVREFRVTREASMALIDRGVPFTLTTSWVTGAHLQACIGYDDRQGTLLLRDPTHRNPEGGGGGWEMRSGVPGGIRRIVGRGRAGARGGGAVAAEVGAEEPAGGAELRGPGLPSGEAGARGGGPAVPAGGELFVTGVRGVCGGLLPRLPVEALTEMPDDGELLLAGARKFHAWGDRERGGELLEEARGKVEEGAWFRAAAAIANFRGNRVRAIECWRRVVELRPAEAVGHRSLVALLDEEEGRERVLEHLGRMVRRYPEDVGFLGLQAEWLGMEEPGCSLAVLRKLLELSPNNIWARRELAWQLDRTGEAEEALEQIDLAIRKAPEMAQGYGMKGGIYHRAHRYEESFPWFEKAVRLDVDYDYAVNHLMGAAERMETVEAALELLREEVERQVSDGSVVMTYRSRAYKFVKPKKLLGQLRGFTEERPDLWQTWAMVSRQALDFEIEDKDWAAAHRTLDTLEHYTPSRWITADGIDVALAEGDDAEVERRSRSILEDRETAPPVLGYAKSLFDKVNLQFYRAVALMARSMVGVRQGNESAMVEFTTGANLLGNWRKMNSSRNYVEGTADVLADHLSWAKGKRAKVLRRLSKNGNFSWWKQWWWILLGLWLVSELVKALVE